MVWCPRTSTASALRLERSRDIFYRGRIAAEIDRSNAGPLLTSVASGCYTVINKWRTLENAPCSPAMQSPMTIVSDYGVEVSDHPNNNNEVVIPPTDSFADARLKIMEAAQKKIGVALVANQTYNWPMMAFNGNGDTPAYFDGRGATINITQDAGAAPFEAGFKIVNVTNWLGIDHFSLKHLTLNCGRKTTHGVVVTGAQQIEISDVRVNGVLGTGFRSEGKPGAGLYYNIYSDLTVKDASVGFEILSLIDSKYANANYIRNFNSAQTATAVALQWTSSTYFNGINADFTGLPSGTTPYVLDTSYSSDIEIENIKTGNTPYSPSMIKTGIAAEGVNIR